MFESGKHVVLIADDDPETLSVLERIMKEEGYEVLSATDGRQAAGMLELTVPDLVLSDVAMPGIDGYSLCRQVKERFSILHIPVILVTGRLSDDDVRKGLDAGAADYVKKPFDVFDLRLRVRNQIRIHELLRREINLSSIVRSIAASAQDAIVVMDNEGRISHWNQSAERVFGYMTEEALGQDLHSLVAPDYMIPVILPALTSFRESGDGKALGKTVELVARHQSGREFPVELSLSRIQIDNGWHAVGIVRDISERRVLESELAHARKLEAVGQLASGIAHEINTPTQFIGDSLHFIKDAVADLQSLLETYRKTIGRGVCGGVSESDINAIKEAELDADVAFVSENLPQAVECALDGVARIAKIVGAMREFAHSAPEEMAPADLTRALENTLIITKNEYKYVADVETDFGDLPPVVCRIDELNQVFLNLIVNAAHAIGDVVENTNGRGTIRVSSCVVGDCAEVRIADTGGGIPQDVQERVFEPFYTTKGVGRGSGQGLAIAWSVVVKKHRGSLTFKSEEGVGTTFVVRIPLAGTNA